MNKIHIGLLFISCWLLLILGGCDKHKGMDEIDFSSQITKSIIENVDELKNGGGLSVYGSRTPSGVAGSIKVFDKSLNNSHLEWNTTSGKWQYPGTTQYWLPDNSYDFIAFFPYSEDKYTYMAGADQSSTASFSYESVYERTDPAATEDVLYSYYRRTYASDADAATVPLEMKHTCASLQFQIKNAYFKPITIENISLEGLYYTGTCTVGANVVWALNGSKAAPARYLGKAGGLVDLPVSNTFVDMFDRRILVLPQNVSGNTDIILRFTVKEEGASDVNRTAVLANTATLPDWAANNHYVYTITITESRIVFDVKVLDWVDENIDL